MRRSQLKKKLGVAVLLSVFSGAVFAAGESGGYVTLQGGSPSGFDTGTSTLDSSTSFGLRLGFRANPNIAIEAGYTSLLNKTNVTYSATTQSQLKAGGITQSSNVTSDGTEVAGIFSFPVGEALSPFVRLGFANMSQTTETVSSKASNNSTTTNKYSGLTYGVGVQYALSKSTAVRLGYDGYNLKCSDSTVVDQKPSNAYLGVTYYF